MDRPDIVGVPRTTENIAEISLVKNVELAAILAVIVVSPTLLMTTVLPSIVATDVSLETYEIVPLELVVGEGMVKVPI